MHGKLSHMREKMQMRRRVEIERLVSMLECDPDEGLKYAIPFSGGSSRGTLRAQGQSERAKSQISTWTALAAEMPEMPGPSR